MQPQKIDVNVKKGREKKKHHPLKVDHKKCLGQERWPLPPQSPIEEYVEVKYGEGIKI